MIFQTAQAAKLALVLELVEANYSRGHHTQGGGFFSQDERVTIRPAL